MAEELVVSFVRHEMVAGSDGKKSVGAPGIIKLRFFMSSLSRITYLISADSSSALHSGNGTSGLP